MTPKFLKPKMLLIAAFAGTFCLCACGDEDTDGDANNQQEQTGQTYVARKDYGYLPNGRRIKEMGDFTMTYNEDGTLKIADGGYWKYTFSDDFTSILFEKGNGATATYALTFNKDGNIKSLRRTSTTDVDISNINTVFLYDGDLLIGEAMERKTVTLNMQTYDLGTTWVDGLPILNVIQRLNIEKGTFYTIIKQFTCDLDNPLRQNSMKLSKQYWGISDIRIILHALGFLGKDPAKFITHIHQERWTQSNGSDWQLNKNFTEETTVNYDLNPDGTLKSDSDSPYSGGTTNYSYE